METISNIDKLVGNTPLKELKNLEKEFNLKGRLFAKLENYNPAGSIKDRVALNIIIQAEKEGKLKKGSIIIEPTSGNTGIGVSAIGVAKGYKVIIVMPDSMSLERQQLIKSYGAELVLTDGKLGMSEAIAKAEEIHKNTPNSIIAGQFTNPANPQAHYETTGPEIYNDLNGKIDYFISGVGTGGTITGIGKFLKEKDKNVKIIAVEPKSSAVLSGGKAGSHKIQGIGAGFIPKVLDTKIYDQIITISNEDAYLYARKTSKLENMLVGFSAGANICAGIEIAQKQENLGKNIVVIIPDKGDRYLSTDLFDNL